VRRRTIEVVELLTSEVVTNAIVHADSAPDIELAVSDHQVRVTVEDQSVESPRLQPVDQSGLRGRGLRLVERLAALCGTDRLPDGRKKVWFEVERDRLDRDRFNR
jgi:anti-sigma regulatory factor (Ser/Thr protein kinase)